VIGYGDDAAAAGISQVGIADLYVHRSSSSNSRATRRRLVRFRHSRSSLSSCNTRLIAAASASRQPFRCERRKGTRLRTGRGGSNTMTVVCNRVVLQGIALRVIGGLIPPISLTDRMLRSARPGIDTSIWCMPFLTGERGKAQDYWLWTSTPRFSTAFSTARPAETGIPIRLSPAQEPATSFVRAQGGINSLKTSK